MPTQSKSQLTQKLSQVPELHGDEQVIEKISQAIEKKVTENKKQKEHLESQFEKSKLAQKGQVQAVVGNLVTNEPLRQKVIAEHQARQSQKTVADLQLQHELQQRQQQAEAQRKSILNRRKKPSLLKSARDLRHPTKTLTKKTLGRIPVLGGIITAGMGLLGALTFLD